MTKTLLILSLLLVLIGCNGEDQNINQSEHLNHGRISVINYWAEWCKPCIKEIPELNALAENRQDIDVYAINFDKLEGEALQTAIKRFEINYRIASFRLSDSLGIAIPSALPTTLIFDQQGTLKESLIGPQTADSLEKVINSL